jgi:hypothetical protein
MIYNKNKKITSSRGDTGLQNIRKSIVNDMFNYKIYRNYINKIDNVPTTALVVKSYNFKEEERKEKKEEILKTFIEHVYGYLNPTEFMESDEMKTEGYRTSYETYQPLLIFNKENQLNYLFLNSLVNNENISSEL